MTKRFIGNTIYAISMLLIVFMRIAVAEGLVDGLSEFQADAVWSSVVQILFMGIIPISLMALFIYVNGEKRPFKQIFTSYGYNRNISKKGWIIVFFISIFTMYITTCISSVWYSFIDIIGYRRGVISAEKYTTETLILDIFLTGCLPAVFEEFTNRGLLFDANENTKNPVSVIILTALMFALMHTNVKQVLYTFVFGLIAGALVYTTKSIWPSMLLHFMNNFVSVMRTYGARNGGGFSFLNDMYDYLLGDVVGGIIATIVFIVFSILVYILMLELSVCESERRITKGISAVKTLENVGKYDNMPLVFVVTMNGLITIFTFVWGLMR